MRASGGFAKGWLALTGLMIVFEALFIYEAIAADLAGLERIFGVFAGLAFLCFGSLLYILSSLEYT